MATGGKVLLVLGALGISGLVGCGNKAPKALNAKTDGVIVQAENVEATFPDKKVSVVSREENIYKIQDATLEDVAQRMPAAIAEEDVIFNMKDPDFDVKKRASVREKIITLGCRKPAKTDPIHAELQLVNEPKFVAPLTVEVGSQDIVVTTLTQKQPTQQSEGSVWDPLKNLVGGTASAATYSTNWVVEGAPGSKTLQESTDKQMAVTPDRPGGYLVAVIVQDVATKTCAISYANLGATHNKPYNGGEGTPGQYSADRFFHVPLVNGEEAWETTQGQGVTIAIVDSGVNYNHPDLAPNIKINNREIAGNGIDDDGNGYVDDVYGFDFAINDAFPFDDESHGTHVAGLAASSVSGIAKKSKILPVKAMLPSGMGTTASLVSALYYAIKQKADIINLSLGGEGPASPLLLAAVKKAKEQGILIVAASGNSTINTDIEESHLTAFDGSNILAIAATDEVDALTDYSNYGLRSVDLAAPGGTMDRPLVSTYANTDLGKYIAYPGTSMAAPVAAGAAALVKSVNKSLSAEQIKAILVGSGRSSAALQGKIASGKVLDAAAAVSSALNLNVQVLTAVQ